MDKYSRNEREILNRYNNSSSAHAYDYDYRTYENVQEEEARLKREKRRQEIENSKYAFAKIKHNAKLIVALSVVFAGATCVSISHAMVIEQRMANDELRSKIASLVNENNTLEAEVSKSIDLDYIEKMAVEKLGMSQPQPYQVVYIDVPKESYTIQYNQETAEEESFSFKDLKELFNE